MFTDITIAGTRGLIGFRACYGFLGITGFAGLRAEKVPEAAAAKSAAGTAVEGEFWPIIPF